MKLDGVSSLVSRNKAGLLGYYLTFKPLLHINEIRVIDIIITYHKIIA